jgi:hypothetical protein
VPYALPAVCLDISSAEAQLGQVHATLAVITRLFPVALLSLTLYESTFVLDITSNPLPMQP